MHLSSSNLQLYGVQSSSISHGFQLIQVDIANGTQTPIGPNFENDRNMYQQVAIDVKNNILYALLSDLNDRRTLYSILLIFFISSLYLLYSIVFSSHSPPVSCIASHV